MGPKDRSLRPVLASLGLHSRCIAVLPSPRIPTPQAWARYSTALQAQGLLGPLLQSGNVRRWLRTSAFAQLRGSTAKPRPRLPADPTTRARSGRTPTAASSRARASAAEPLQEKVTGFMTAARRAPRSPPARRA